MPFNPCGRVCDFARREYRTAARFFRSSNVEDEITWRRAADDAPALGFPSSIMSNDWLDDGYDDSPATEVGEVYGAPRPYTPSPPLLGLNYLHVCGTEEDFARGAVYDPERVPVLYDDQGLPACCDGPAVPVFSLVVDFHLIEPTAQPVGNSCVTSEPIIPVLSAAGQVREFIATALQVFPSGLQSGWLFTAWPSGIRVELLWCSHADGSLQWATGNCSLTFATGFIPIGGSVDLPVATPFITLINFLPFDLTTRQYWIRVMAL